MFENLKIGYVPYNASLTQSADRRRFPYFAKTNNVSFEIADEKKTYDVVLLPAPCNLSKWMQYKKRNQKTLFIFEMVDSLIYQNDWFNLLFKGTGRYLVKKEDRPCFRHKSLLIEWIKAADIVICSNPVVKKEILKWNKNVVLDLDYLEHEYPLAKKDYSINGKMKLFWEGQSVVLPQLLQYKRMFEKVNSFCELHIVTSESYPLFGQFVNRKTESLLAKLPIETHFHQWDLKLNATLFKGFDCGIIPLNKKDIYGWHKPANKLISFWLSGIPTIVSDTPAYVDVISKSENNFICSTEEEWVLKIKEIYKMTAEKRKTIAQSNFSFAKKYYSNEVHHQFWIQLFDNISKMTNKKEERSYPIAV